MRGGLGCTRGEWVLKRDYIAVCRYRLGLRTREERKPRSRSARTSEDDNNFVLKRFLRITRFPPPTFPSIRSLPSSFLPTSFADNADTISRFFPRLSLALFSFSSLFGENEGVLSSKKRDTSSPFSNTFHLLTVILILVILLEPRERLLFLIAFYFTFVGRATGRK